MSCTEERGADLQTEVIKETEGSGFVGNKVEHKQDQTPEGLVVVDVSHSLLRTPACIPLLASSLIVVQVEWPAWLPLRAYPLSLPGLLVPVTAP